MRTIAIAVDARTRALLNPRDLHRSQPVSYSSNPVRCRRRSAEAFSDNTIAASILGAVEGVVSSRQQGIGRVVPVNRRRSSGQPGWPKRAGALFETLNRRRRGQLCGGWRGPGWRRRPRDSGCLRTCRRRGGILTDTTWRCFAPGKFPRTGPSKSPGMSNGGSSGKANHGARDRAHRAEHHRARYGAQGGIAAAPLGPALCRRERQRDGRREDKSFHLGVPTKQSDGAS
jgi:hypothetical protein